MLRSHCYFLHSHSEAAITTVFNVPCLMILVLCAYHCHAPPPTRGRVGDYVGICKLFAARGVGHLTQSYFSVKHTYADIGTCSSVWTVVTSRG